MELATQNTQVDFGHLEGSDSPVYSSGLENRQAKASWVRIPPPPPRKIPQVDGVFFLYVRYNKHKMNDDSSWEYKPDGKEIAATPDLPGSALKSEIQPKSSKNEAVTWTASEYIDHTRGPGWYLALVAGTTVLAALIYFITKDYFATGVVALMGIIVGVFSRQKPKQVAYELSTSGLKAGEKVYPLNLFKSFALIREGELLSVNLIPIKRFMPPLSIYLDPSDEEKIVGLLGSHLPLEEGSLDPVERLSRRLRF